METPEYADRIHFSMESLLHPDVTMMKALELILTLEVPPPFYLSADMVDDLLVITAMPVYDMQKFSEFAEEHVDEDALGHLNAVMPFLFMGQRPGGPVGGTSKIIAAKMINSRIYVSMTHEEDVKRLDVMAKMLGSE